MEFQHYQHLRAVLIHLRIDGTRAGKKASRLFFFWQVDAEYLHLWAMHCKNNTKSNHHCREEILIAQLEKLCYSSCQTSLKALNL